MWDGVFLDSLTSEKKNQEIYFNHYHYDTEKETASADNYNYDRKQRNGDYEAMAGNST